MCEAKKGKIPTVVALDTGEGGTVGIVDSGNDCG
jgi:hypothetical protein